MIHHRCHCKGRCPLMISSKMPKKSDALSDGCGDAQNDAKRSFKRCSLQTMISWAKIWCKSWCPRTPKRCPKQNRKDVDVDDIHYHVVSCRCAIIWCSPLVLLKEVLVRDDKEDGYRMFVNHGWPACWCLFADVCFTYWWYWWYLLQLGVTVGWYLCCRWAISALLLSRIW